MSLPPHPVSAPGTPDIGAVLGGRYRVVRRIGEGGMGVVVEAENALTGKRVAIKWMHPHVASRPEAAERFLREARASARVRHPNVVDVYDVVHEGETCFLVMELLDGEPLSAVLERGGMPAHELLALLLEAMRGVSAAHKQGVIHRDIKPDNIFLCEETDRELRTPKVLDFGISKVTGADAMSLTKTGAALGTPMYMSFEQLCGVKDIDARTDVYAFGVILYEALTGQPPFHAESFPELIVKISNTRPTPPKLLRPDIPRALDDLVQRSMAKERDERVLSLDLLIRALEPFTTSHSFRAQMTADDNPLPRVVAYSYEPPKHPAPFVVQGRESAPIATPMEANVPVPPPPRSRDALTWLIAGAAIVTALGALTWYGSSPEPTANERAGGEVRLPGAASADNPEPMPPADGHSAAAAQPEPTPSRAEQPAPEPASAPRTSQSVAAPTAKPAAPTATPAARPTPTKTPPPLAAGATQRAPLAASDKAALPATHRSGLTPVAPAPVVIEPPPEKPAPATVKPAPASDPRFRAGRPRTEDF